MNKAILLSMALITAVSMACSRQTTGTGNQVVADPDSYHRTIVMGTGNYVPKATVFKMSGNYANNVAVTIDEHGRLTYYPAPTDITLQSKPVPLKDGWWLNRQGLSSKSVFTSWTYEQYSKLRMTPSQEQIKAHIIPGARVTQFKRTSVPADEAMGQLDKIKEEL